MLMKMCGCVQSTGCRVVVIVVRRRETKGERVGNKSKKAQKGE